MHRPSRIRWTVVTAATLLGFGLVGAGAGAVVPPPTARRALLIVDRPNDPFAERVRAEVAGLGLMVVTLEPWRTHEPLGPLEVVARAQHAVVAIRMLPSRKGVEVWMADETSGRSLLRQLIVDENAGGPNQNLIALQTAELLRTSLLSQRRPAGPPAPGATKVATSTATATTNGGDGSPTIGSGPAQATPVEADLDAALGVLFAPDSGSAAFQAWLSLRRSIGTIGTIGSTGSVGSRLMVALDVSAPLRAASLSGPEGSARIGAYLVGLALLARLTEPGSVFVATAGGGVAFIDVRADGQAGAPLQGTSAGATTGAAFARADGLFEATRWLRLGARAVVGATTSRVVVRFAGNDAGTWGRPFLGGFLLADFCWR